MHNRTFKWMMSSVLFIIIILFFSFSVEASEEKQNVLKVGYLDYQGFVDKQSDGSYSGYCVEYLQKISDYTDYQYEYVYGSWPELLDKLERGEIDLLCNAQYTPERAEQFDYSEYPIGYTQGLLYTRRDNNQLLYEDFQSFNGMQVGIIDGNAMEEKFLQYCEKNNFSCNLVKYSSEEDMLSALQSKKLDAICSEHLARHTNLTLLGRFGSDSYYIISYKDNPYMDDINYALQIIKTNVDFETELYHKYYDSSTAETTLQFTVQEKAYIENSNPLRVGLNQNRAPFAEYNSDTGCFSGICVDILDEIESQSGLKFEYVPMELGATSKELMETGKYDILCGIERDNFISNENLTATSAFLESAIVPVGLSGKELDIHSKLHAAVPASFQALQKTLTSQYPNMELDYYKTNRECLDAVLSGKDDVFIQNTHIIGMLLQEPKYETLDVLPVEIMTEHTAMVIDSTLDPCLLSILNKCIDGLNQATVSSSLISHTFANPYKYTTADILYKFRYQIAAITVLILLCFLLLINLVAMKQNGEQKLRKKNELLADAVAQANRASDAKSQFLSRMSHEIRTPMNAIVGLTEIAGKHTDEPDKVKDYLAKIATSSKVLLNIINDVLDMSAIESNKLVIANEEFDLKQILKNISTVYYPQCKAKGISFEMATDVEDEVLLGDSLRINQILLNLISNAYKFTKSQGMIRIIIKETAKKDDMVFIRFTVSDDGCGMTEDMQKRLFRPFEQETAGTAQKYGGSGLGLSITKNLIDMMQGAIQVTSEKGKGTTFDVDIPFQIQKSSRKSETESFGNIYCLIVDDNPSSQEYTSIVLQRMMLKHDTAKSGAEALLRLKEAEDKHTPYQVCLIDSRIHSFECPELIKHIRSEMKKIPVIIVSAYDITEAEEQMKPAGVDYFVPKPLFQSTIFNVLMEMTNGKLVEEKSANENYDFSGHKILLAEDQELNAEIAIEILKEVHLSVDYTSNGEEALVQFEKSAPGTYDAILMDVQMPVMDGYEATRKIRSLERKDAAVIPIFAMTANAFTEDVTLALSAGMNGHIAKPIDTGVLYETLKKAIL